METDKSLEKDLLESARSLDRQALAQIYDLYSPGLYRYAMRILADPGVAEECVAEIFSRFLHAMQKKKGPRDHLQAYLYRMAHNWIVDQFRHEPLTAQLRDDLPGTDPDIETDVDKNLGSEHLRLALHQLTLDQQQVIILKFLEDVDNETIARTLHKSVGAIKSIQHRALASLQRLLRE